MADRYWVGGTGTWDASATTHWSATSGGASGASAPTASDNVIFDANSNTGTGNFTVTTSGSPACLDFSTGGAGGALDGIMTLAVNAAVTVAGDLTFPASNFAVSGTAALTFTATSGTKVVTTNGVSLTCDVTFNGVGGTWQLGGNLTTARPVTLTNGTLDLSTRTLTAFSFSSNNANTRTIAFGTGKIVLTANNFALWTTATATGLTLTGTPNVELSYAGATGTRTINAGNTAGENETHAVPFKVLAGTDAILITGTSAVGSLDFSGYAGTLANVALKLYGDLTLGAGMTVTGGGNAWTFAKTTGVQTLTPNGVSLGQPIVRNGAGGTLRLAGNFSIGATGVTLTNGTIDLNGFSLTAATFTTAAGTKNLTFNGGTLIVTATSATAFNNAQPANFTTTAGTGTGSISLTNASAKTFVGGGSTYNCTLDQGGAGTLTITGSNTFADITNTTQPASVLFTAGTTTTFTSGFSLSGTAGNQITIGSATAAGHTLSKASGAINVSYCDISRSTAQGGATWNSYTTNGNVDNGNNAGWIFTAPAGGFGNFLPFF